MPLVDVNYLAILACGILFMIVGALWYSPLLFGKPYGHHPGHLGLRI
jgi:hypothetical protein